MYADVTMHKAEKYSFAGKECPEELRGFFFGTFGCVRKVYNLYVAWLYDELEKAGYKGGEPIPKGLALPEVTYFKKQYPYLKEADSLALANVKIGFERAVKRYNEEADYTAYTKRALRRASSGTEPLSFRDLKGMPGFHSKAKGYFSYMTNCQYTQGKDGKTNATIRLEKDMLYLPKLRQGIRLNVHRPLPEGAVIKNVTISMEADGHFYASIGYEYTVRMDMTVREAAAAGDGSILGTLGFIGLDYLQKDFYVDSEGRKANCPHCYRKSEEALARLQRKLSRMQPGSKNYEKTLAKIRRLHVKIKNQRKDFVCKEAAYLASTYDVAAVEDINLRSMGEALRLGKNLHDNGFGMFRERLARKLEEKGSILIKVPRFFASTKICSCCHSKNPDVTLGVKAWTCPACGMLRDRDWNAAINIREKGMEIFADHLLKWMEEDAKARNRAMALHNARKRGKKTA